jgi:hypothetical protein
MDNVQRNTGIENQFLLQNLIETLTLVNTKKVIRNNLHTHTPQTFSWKIGRNIVRKSYKTGLFFVLVPTKGPVVKVTGSRNKSPFQAHHYFFEQETLCLSRIKPRMLSEASLLFIHLKDSCLTSTLLCHTLDCIQIYKCSHISHAKAMELCWSVYIKPLCSFQMSD